MKYFFCLLICFLSAGCTDRKPAYYQQHYFQNKAAYNSIDSLLTPVLNKDSVYKLGVAFTGKRLIVYPYINDSELYHFYNVGLTEADELKVTHLMYQLGLEYTTIFRDSIQYRFSGRNKNIITVYKTPGNSHSGLKIDKNVYLRIVSEQNH